MSRRGIEVVPYSIAKLGEVFARHAGADPDFVARKPHLKHFETYLGTENGIGATTIVIEPDYTDRDYLDDYAAYFVRCLDKYRSRCCRLHFFKGDFELKHFRAVVCGKKKVEELGEYLGFVVVRPLPETFVGRTCLKEPPADIAPHHRITQKCHAHVAGLYLEVESLPFQEQDHAVAACATSALWSALHGTARLFHHSVETPAEITSSAAHHLPSSCRPFPSAGLSISEMVGPIKRVGLAPEVAKVAAKPALQTTAYAYLRAGIPFVMMAKLYDVSEPDKPHPYLEGKESPLHAVAVTGYRLGAQQCTRYSEEFPTLLRSSRINALYVHDDQVGPFAKMEITEPSPKLLQEWLAKDEHRDPCILTSSWPGTSGKPGTVCFAPQNAMLPLYPKIRIGLDPILGEIISFDRMLTVMREKIKRLAHAPEVEWDVFLTTTNELKSEWIAKHDLFHLDRGYLWRLVEKPLPRFVWRCSALDGEDLCLDLLFDATDVEQGDYLAEVVAYDQGTVKSIRDVIRSDRVDVLVDCLINQVPGLKHSPRWFNWFRKRQAVDTQ